MQSCHQGRWRGVSLSCAAYAESLLLLNLPYARSKQRDKWVTTGELSALRGLLGQWMWLATPVILQLQAPLSLLLGYVRVTTVSTKLEANKFLRRALICSLTQLRTHVHDSFCVVGCIDGSWPCGRDGQCGRLIGITNSCFLDHAACHGTVEVGSSCKNLECS